MHDAADTLSPAWLRDRLRALLPMEADAIRIGPGGASVDAPGDVLVVSESQDGSLCALMWAAQLAGDGTVMSSNIIGWTIVPQHAIREAAWVEAVLACWPDAVRRFVEGTDEDNLPFIVSPQFLEPTAAFEGEATTDAAVLTERLVAGYERTLEVILDDPFPVPAS